MSELQQRFKEFGLQWPEGDIVALQKIRNNFEHYNSSEPKKVVQKAIAACFPLVGGFLRILGLDEPEILEESWSVMLQEEQFFIREKAKCDSTLANISIGGPITRSSRLSCPNCNSSLLYQTDPENAALSSVDVACGACVAKIEAQVFAEMIIDAEYGVHPYLVAKDGLEPSVHDCPDCGCNTYVTEGEIDECLFCEYQVTGSCARCGTPFDIQNQSINCAFQGHSFNFRSCRSSR